MVVLVVVVVMMMMMLVVVVVVMMMLMVAPVAVEVLMLEVVVAVEEEVVAEEVEVVEETLGHTASDPLLPRPGNAPSSTTAESPSNSISLPLMTPLSTFPLKTIAWPPVLLKVHDRIVKSDAFVTVIAPLSWTDQSPALGTMYGSSNVRRACANVSPSNVRFFARAR